MIAEKPKWIRHEGTQIFSIDVQPGGLRFATGGGDHKVRIWNMKSVGKDLEADASIPKLLATIRDHFGSVNCVRWARHGRYVASGSDDQMILIHERKPGSGTTEFGSGEPPDIENWKVATTFRGHTADVVDLNWSPDDSTLASASLDNTVHIWDLNNGICTAVLRGHSSLVKGVTWDPIGSFIASQSDDKTVIIWRTSDWSLAHRTEGHWAKSVGNTFFRRLGWSPCGNFITTTNGFQKPRHSAPVLERGDWSATFDFLGHNAPVIVVKFNHSMFKRNSSSVHELKSAPLAWTNGSSKTGGRDSQLYNVIAIGSQDKTITVWTTASPRPLFVAKHFFSLSVVDLSWSPDGYSLFACSADGTVATFHFDVSELGHRLNDAELDELRRSRYGDVQGRQANLAESPAQLLIEAAAVKKTTSKKPATNGSQKRITSKPSSDLGVMTKVPVSQNDDGKKSDGATGDGINKSSTRMPSPVKQREYRRPDGRKRIIPEAVGVSGQQEPISGCAHSEALDLSISSDQRKDQNGVLPVAPTFTEASLRKERAGVTARATVSDSLVIEKVPAVAGKDGNNSTEQAGLVKFQDSDTSGGNLLIRVFDKKGGEETLPLCLEAHPKEHAANDFLGTAATSILKETEITCTQGTETRWTDRISGKVTVLAGNANFWAIGCQDGALQIYTKCGRRAMPMMMMGSAAVFIDCDEAWKLLLVTRKGSLYVWDLFDRKCLLHDTLSSLIPSDLKANTKGAGTIKVISAKLSKSGLPLVVLATRHAYLFDTSLMCWLRVADDCFPASNFASSWKLGSLHGGELSALQVDVKKFLARKPGWSRVTDDGLQTRAHLETQLASALALESPKEYRQCLLSYVRFLAREADECRLREVCESFLGPPTGTAGTSASDQKPMWDACILGIRKHKLLREDILPAMASNRKVQRLLNEFLDLLSEYDASGNMEEKNIATSVTNQQENTDKMNTDTPMTEQINHEIPEANQATSDQPITKEKELHPQTAGQKDLTPETKDPMDVDLQGQTELLPSQMNLDPPNASENPIPATTAKEIS